jgi:hypothetical protein
MTEEGDPHHSPNRVTFAEGYSLVMADGTFPANAGSTEQTKQCRGQTGVLDQFEHGFPNIKV